jgi:hypothetical protein
VRSATRASRSAFSIVTSASAIRRAVISRSSSALILASPGSASARGKAGMSAMTVAHETAAVNSLAAPDSRYAGHQKIVASIRCVIPQAAMNAQNSQKIGRNGTSGRRRVK